MSKTSLWCDSDTDGEVCQSEEANMRLPANYEELSIPEKRTVREEYIKRQDGLCFYCKAPLNGRPREDVQNRKINKRLFPENFFKWPVHLHHDHETGMTIGAVHCHCNAVLWQYHGE